jgi:hypothetical protein
MEAEAGQQQALLHTVAVVIWHMPACLPACLPDWPVCWVQGC